MTKHHLQMVVMSLLFTLGLAACSGGGSSLPGAVNLPNTAGAMGATSASGSTAASAMRATSAASATTASYLAIDSGSTAAVGAWVADTDFTFTGWGEAASYTSPIDTSHVTNAPPQSVYQSNRWAPTITYTIPALTPNSPYTIRLHFAECWFNSAGQRLFNVSINGSQVLTNFDIFQAAGGENVAIAKSFTANADGSGKITIYLSATVNNALISGIEVTGASSVPTPAPGTSVIAISAGNPKAVGTWLADTDYTFTAPGAAETFGTPVKTYLVTNPAPQAVYQSERWAKTITYVIPRLTPNGAYTVRLSFVESFFAAKGLRLFDVAINGTTVLTNFDIFATAGGHHIEITRSFATNADANGKVTIGLSASVNDAVISGVEVTGATIGATPTPVPTAAPPSPTPAPVPTPVNGANYPQSATRPYPQWPGGAGLTAAINEAAVAANVKSTSASAINLYTSYGPGGWDSDSLFASPTYGAAGYTVFASINDPTYSINCSGNNPPYCGQNNRDAGMSNVHIPLGARTQNSNSGGGCDCHFYLVEPYGWYPNGSDYAGTVWPSGSGIQYTFEINNAGYGSASCSGSTSLYCTTFNDNSGGGQLWVSGGGGVNLSITQSSGYWTGSQIWNNGYNGLNGSGTNPPQGYGGSGNASNSTYVGLQITAEDMLQGAIKHEQDWYLLCAAPADNDEWPSAKTTTDSNCNTVGGGSNSGWHYGGHMFLQRTDAQINADAQSVPLNALQVIEAKGLAHYGAMLGDTLGTADGGPAFKLNVDNNDPVWNQVASKYSNLMTGTSGRGGYSGYNFPIGLPVSYMRSYMVEVNSCIIPGQPHYSSGTGNCGDSAP